VGETVINMNNSLLLDLISGKNNPSNGEWVFASNAHQRYQNGKAVMGLQKGHTRNIKIEKNISGNEGYSITILNPNPNPFSGSITMATKPMKIISKQMEIIELRGYGNDRLSGAPFSDYGLTVYLEKGEPNRIILHMHDRNIDIEYLP